jgi:hypothetical protein
MKNHGSFTIQTAGGCGSFKKSLFFLSLGYKGVYKPPRPRRKAGTTFKVMER